MNVPMLRETDDEVYLNVFCEVVPRAVQRFAPDVLVTEFGADAHFDDPLAHLRLTTEAYEQMARTFRELSPGKWLCVGGGGYRDSVVPRVWALLWGEMTGKRLPNELPRSYVEKYPENSSLRDPELSVESVESHRAAGVHAAASKHAIECVEFLRNEIELLRG
jgi:acetoin utilization protein AcuC